MEFIAAAELAGRPVALIDPGAYLAQSRTFNPLSTCSDAAQVVERIQPFFPDSREEFFETEVSNPDYS